MKNLFFMYFYIYDICNQTNNQTYQTEIMDNNIIANININKYKYILMINKSMKCINFMNF